MKRVILSLLAATAMSGAAIAADLPSRRAAPAYIPPVFTWTGFYAGVNAGYAFNGDNKMKDLNFNGYYADNFATTSKSDDGSFTGGAQVGYNYQMGSFVIGAEADFNFIDLKRESTSNDYYAGSYGYGYGLAYDELRGQSKVEWFGTVRARVGFTPVDRLLVFVTGGLAYGSVKTTASYENYSTGYGLYGSKRDTQVGWTVGAGAEYAITNNLTVKGEYAYVDLGDKRRTWTDGYYGYNSYGNVLSTKTSTDFHVVRAGLNYKF
ncbi:outer membrane protein [Microvirga sp. W0021]|uniref:Outer membrane protein n=1 Tax=Hohaiivirga grylli TaxID=3133970 RepID=A0ABV0BGS3_9HYPH